MTINWDPVKRHYPLYRLVSEQSVLANALELWSLLYGTFTASQPVGKYLYDTQSIDKHVYKKHLGKYHRIGLLDYVIPPFLLAHVLDITGKQAWRTEGGRVLSLMLLPITLPLYVLKVALNAVKLIIASTVTLLALPFFALMKALQHKSEEPDKTEREAKTETMQKPASLSEIKQNTKASAPAPKVSDSEMQRRRDLLHEWIDACAQDATESLQC